MSPYRSGSLRSLLHCCWRCRISCCSFSYVSFRAWTGGFLACWFHSPHKQDTDGVVRVYRRWTAALVLLIPVYPMIYMLLLLWLRTCTSVPARHPGHFSPNNFTRWTNRAGTRMGHVQSIKIADTGHMGYTWYIRIYIMRIYICTTIFDLYSYKHKHTVT